MPPGFVPGAHAMPFRSSRRFSFATALIILGLLMVYAGSARATTPTAVMINEFMPNTGSDSTTAEWVELFNSNPYIVDVSGWQIVDDTLSHSRTTIAPGTLMPANSLLVVFMTTNIFNN